MEETIFHKIVKGEVPCHKVWEDENHLAFLSIYPNTEGVTVVIPKKFSPSYFADCSDEIITNLLIAAKKVAKILDLKLEDVGRTALVFEGFGVDYLHIKLFPMHGTILKEWKPIESNVNNYFDKYPGYIISNDSKRESDEVLSKLAKKLRD
ncbi:MAG: HIT family protein [Candidatus Woesearchaeota archaeon]